MALFSAITEGRLSTLDDFVDICGCCVDKDEIEEVKEFVDRKIQRIQRIECKETILQTCNERLKHSYGGNESDESQDRTEKLNSHESKYTCLSVMRGKPPILLTREHLPILKQLSKRIEVFLRNTRAAAEDDGSDGDDDETDTDSGVCLTSPPSQTVAERDTSTFSPVDATHQRAAVERKRARCGDKKKAVTDAVQRRISALRRRLIRDTIHIAIFHPPDMLYEATRGSHGIKQLPILLWKGEREDEKSQDADLCALDMKHSTYLIAVSCAHVKHDGIRSALQSLISSDRKNLEKKVVNVTGLPRTHPLSLLMDIAYRPESLREQIEELAVVNVKRVMLLARCMGIGTLEAVCRESLLERKWVLVGDTGT